MTYSHPALKCFIVPGTTQLIFFFELFDRIPYGSDNQSSHAAWEHVHALLSPSLQCKITTFRNKLLLCRILVPGSITNAGLAGCENPSPQCARCYAHESLSTLYKTPLNLVHFTKRCPHALQNLNQVGSRSGMPIRPSGDSNFLKISEYGACSRTLL